MTGGPPSSSAEEVFALADALLRAEDRPALDEVCARWPELTRDGAPAAPLRVSAEARLEAEGERVAALHAARWALVEARAALQLLRGAQDLLVSTVGHDLRTPLTILLGQCQLLEEGLVEAARLPRTIEVIRRQGERIQELLDRVVARHGRAPVGFGGSASLRVAALVREVAGAGLRARPVEVEGDAELVAPPGLLTVVLAELLEALGGSGGEPVRARVRALTLGSGAPGLRVELEREAPAGPYARALAVDLRRTALTVGQVLAGWGGAALVAPGPGLGCVLDLPRFWRPPVPVALRGGTAACRAAAEEALWPRFRVVPAGGAEVVRVRRVEGEGGPGWRREGGTAGPVVPDRGLGAALEAWTEGLVVAPPVPALGAAVRASREAGDAGVALAVSLAEVARGEEGAAELAAELWLGAALGRCAGGALRAQQHGARAVVVGFADAGAVARFLADLREHAAAAPPALGLSRPGVRLDARTLGPVALMPHTVVGAWLTGADLPEAVDGA